VKDTEVRFKEFKVSCRNSVKMLIEAAQVEQARADCGDEELRGEEFLMMRWQEMLWRRIEDRAVQVQQGKPARHSAKRQVLIEAKEGEVPRKFGRGFHKAFQFAVHPGGTL
jgi:hypothetical protein